MSNYPPQQRRAPQYRAEYREHREPPRERPQMIVVRDSAAMLRLRATAYVLCSLAAAVFLVVVVYGYIQLRQASAAIEQLTGGGPIPSLELPPTPEAPPEPPTIGG